MYNVYKFFNSHGVDFQNKKVLDYGCDEGRLLRQYEVPLLDYYYTGFDIRKDVIDLNKAEFPKQKWIYQNLHNPAYNPAGTETLDLKTTYDLIVSFSIFTHTSYEEFDKCIHYFYDHLNRSGEMFVTFLAMNNTTVLKTLYEKRLNRFGFCDSFYNPKDYYYVSDNNIVATFPSRCDLILTIYNNNAISKYGNIIQNEFQNILHIKKD